MAKKSLGILLLLCVISAVSCLNKTNAAAPSLAVDQPAQAGAACKVQFRRDALGAAADMPVPPTSDSHNGAALSSSGQFVRLTSDWFVMNRENAEVWIPVEAILSVEFAKPTPEKQ